MLAAVQLWSYDLQPLGERLLKGRTTSGCEASGTAMAWRVDAPEFALSLLDVRWDTGERDVRALDVARGRPAIQHLGKGHRRLGVYAQGGDLWAEFRMVRIKAGDPNEWTVLANADAAEWDGLLGAGWQQDLARAFGVQVGTKGALTGTWDKTRDRLCVRFPADREQVLPHLFVLTRVLPLVHGLTK